MTFADHSKEIRTYKDNRLNGPANIFMANGDRIELIYQVSWSLMTIKYLPTFVPVRKVA